MIGFDCTCERGRHTAPLEGYEICRGAIGKLPEILKEYKRIMIVADKNTYAAAGERVEAILKDAGMLSHSFVLDGDVVLPNAETVGKILIHLHDIGAKSDIFAYSPKPDLLLAVGSGTINDCCRLVSYRLGIPYGVFGTAASMDGYVSAGSPILHDGTKTTIQGTTPKYFIADVDVAKEAPYEMLLAGLGDMFGKYVGMADWELSHLMTGEYLCERIRDDVIRATDNCLVHGYGVAKRDPDSVKSILEGFLVTGLGMAYTGNSRPASGSEHILAHAWELFDVEECKKPNLHGLEVCEGARIVGSMYKMLLDDTNDETVKAIIRKYMPYFDAVEEFCVNIRMPSPVTEKEQILRGIRRALTLRDRYTILFYLRDRGLLEAYAERAADAFLKIVRKNQP